MKNITHSKTLLASLAFVFVSYLSPAIERIIESGQVTGKDYKDAATAVLFVVTSACLRYAATETVYTSKGLPGRNKPEADPIDDTEIHY